MTETDPDRVFDGEILDGFRRYYLREYETGEVEVYEVQRMHRFGSGYEDRRPPLSLTLRLREHQARAVRDLLADHIDTDRPTATIEPTERTYRGHCSECERPVAMTARYCPQCGIRFEERDRDA